MNVCETSQASDRRSKAQRWASAFGIPEGSRVLSIGFRDVEELLTLAEIVGPAGAVTGIDLDAKRVEDSGSAASRLDGIRVECGSILDIPCDVSSIDVVLCKGVLHEVRSLDRAIREMARVTRRGGRILVVDVRRFSWLCFVRYRIGSLLKRRTNPDLRPGFTRLHLQRLVSRSPVREIEYQILESLWTLGPCRAAAFLWVLTPKNS